MFQLNDQVFHWKVNNRTIWVPKKYLKSEVENGRMTYLSYQQQGCILYNLWILLVVFYLTSINWISFLIWNQKSACWSLAGKWSENFDSYLSNMCTAWRVFHFKNWLITTVQEVLKMEWHIWTCTWKLYIWKDKS